MERRPRYHKPHARRPYPFWARRNRFLEVYGATEFTDEEFTRVMVEEPRRQYMRAQEFVAAAKAHGRHTGIKKVWDRQEWEWSQALWERFAAGDF